MDPGLAGSTCLCDLDMFCLRDGYRFDAAEADRWCAFMTDVRVELEPWQVAWGRRLHGWRRPDGMRRYLGTHVWGVYGDVSRLLAAEGLFLTMADNEPWAQVYRLARTRTESEAAIGEAMAALRPSGSWGRAEFFSSSFYVPSSGSRFQVVSVRPWTKHGTNAHGLLVDGLHDHESPDLYDAVRTSMGARRQPLEIVFSAVPILEDHFTAPMYKRAKNAVEGGEIDPSLLTLINPMLPS